jgi:PAS domain S-box-containing protein
MLRQLDAERDAHALIHGALVGEALQDGPVAVFVFDENGRYLAVNRYACELLGYDRDELLQRRIGELSTRDHAVDFYLEAIRTGRPATTSVRHKDGSVVRLRFRATATRVAGMPVFVGVAEPTR